MKPLTVCVFAKPPRAGRVKTRLIAGVGEGGAAQLAEAFLLDTLESLRRLPDVRVIVATTGDLGLDVGPVEVWDQGGGTLGQRLERVLGRAIGGGTPALAIGADTPGLPLDLVTRAGLALEAHPAALGACDDGGFWGLGLTSISDGLLADIDWSTERTCEQTCARLVGAGLVPQLLPGWFDLDTPGDLVRLRRLLDRQVVQAPRTRALLDSLLPAPAMKVSVVIPVLDEERRIGRLLRDLSRTDGISEIIVVDGGSRDGTPDIVRAFPDALLLDSTPGRGPQQNAGARVATGDVLLFLHADTRLPEDAMAHIRSALADPRVVAGAFRTWTVRDEPFARDVALPAALLHLADLRSRYTSLPYGDQGIFVRREVFDRVGGFPPQPLFEDVELSRRLRRQGRIETVRASVEVSGRRFFRRPVRETLLVNLLPLAYRLGVSPTRLSRVYRNFR